MINKLIGPLVFAAILTGAGLVALNITSSAAQAIAGAHAVASR